MSDSVDDIYDDMDNSLAGQPGVKDGDIDHSVVAAGVSSETTGEMVRQIFDGVVRIFNDSLHPFLKNSVDTEVQKKFLFDSLDQSVKEYFARVDSEIKTKCESQWQSERNKFQNEVKSLKEKIRELEEQRGEIKEKQLSAERQKRALNDRLRDLENQVTELEAEKEQYDLENKSLINKAKVVNVYETEMAEMRAEMDRMRGQALKAPDDTAVSLSDGEKERLEQEIASLKQENKKLKDAHEALKVKDEMSDVMLNDFKTKLAEANKKIQEKDDRLAEAQKMGDEIEAINKQVLQFETIKTRKDEKISQLKENLREVQSEVETLRSTIAQNLYSYTEREKVLKDELENLKNQKSISVNDKPVKKEIRSQRKKRIDDRSDIEDIIGDTDWLVSKPPKESSMRQNSSADPDFGYQAPPKKNTPPDNDAQMSLW